MKAKNYCEHWGDEDYGNQESTYNRDGLKGQMVE